MKKYIILVLLALFISLTSFAQNRKIYDVLNLEAPGLTQVKSYYEAKDLKKAGEALLEYYINKENIYLKRSGKETSYIKDRYKEDIATSINTADEVRNKYFLFRYEWDMEKTIIPYQFKGDIDWQINPFGDPEWTFMLSRHKYWIDLGRAYYLTGKEKYAKVFVDQALDWIDNNPITKKTQWTTWRRIEAGLRMENWVKTFEYVKNSKYVTPEFIEKFLGSIYQHIEYLDEHFNRHSQMSNWGVLEFNGLFTAACFMPELKDSKQLKERTIDRLNICIQNQILEDGTQWEQSPMYHNEVMHCFMNTILVAKRTNTRLPDKIIEKTKAMAFANIEWQKPNYNEPLLGDSDDNDLRGILTTAAILFSDGTIKSRANSELDYENYFMFNADDENNYKAIKEVTPDFLSAYQFNTGDLYSRSSWNEDAFYSSLHLRRIGGGHSHDDLLHFSLFAYGKDYLIDAGRFTYVDNKWRKYFKENTAHNTLGVDGLTNSIYAGSWSNSYEAKSDGAFVVTKDNYDYAEAINKAYLRLEDPVLMKRRMLYLKPDVWLLIDSFEAKEEHSYSQYFNFPDKKVEVVNGGLSTTYDKDNLRIQLLKEANIEIQDAWWSPDYNFKEEISRAVITKQAKGFNSFISLLYFNKNNTVEYEKVPVYDRWDKQLPDNQAEAVKLKIGNTEYTLVVAHNIAEKLNTFLLVEGQVLSGGVILIEKNGTQQKISVIK